MSDLYKELEEAVVLARRDIEKFYQKGNSTAGTRVRKAMQNVKRIAQEIRMDIQRRKREES